MVLKALKLWNQIHANQLLKSLEKEGLCRGEERGKIPNVPIPILTDSLEEQWNDFHAAFMREDVEEMKKCLADLRNVAGIMFLRLTDELEVSQ